MRLPLVLWLGCLFAKQGVLGGGTYTADARAVPSGMPNMSMELCRGLNLEEASIDTMQTWMTRRKLMSVDLVRCYLRRMEQTRDTANSVIEINPDAEYIAISLDFERRMKNKVRSKLHGIPFTVKDNIASKDQMKTTAGSKALEFSVVREDAFVLDRLRKMGAVLLGKAAMSEWADMRSSNYSEGYSARGGQCYSAYNMTVNPGGSSTGSAVGVSINAAAFSIGTETDGSVINPAMRNCIVGFKPTVGLTSRSGVIPESHNQDSVGTFGRTVKDAVIALDAIYGYDVKDKATWDMCDQSTVPQWTAGQGFQQFLTTRDALARSPTKRAAAFGIPWNSFWVHADAETQRALTRVIKHLRDAGAEVYNRTEITDYDEIVSPHGWDWDYGSKRRWANRSEYTYVKVDFVRGINAYLNNLESTRVHNLTDIMTFNVRNDYEEGGTPQRHPAFYSGQDGFEAAEKTGGVMDETYHQALNYSQTMTRRGINGALDRKGTKLNALLVPLEPGQSYQIAAQAGYPMVTIPVGVHKESGMGIGLGLMQSAWQEHELVRWASAIEDLLMSKGYQRDRPKWRGYHQRKIPLPL
ncbi:hypothetical protein CDD80_3806 [Ophiocordyceps camponoti-rufipedis]|uniref:Amidase domain-containing protein n=1 Tax=Ophiocordyceps camponoti-rufipedis TaxID=2004952 RepID=A0A2C5YXI5_9HYPO|nr:hypothetical protein CDD80_3806 [Ophiocordyceps camponoti-rufipedis]